MSKKKSASARQGLPSTAEIDAEYQRVRNRSRFAASVRSTVNVILIVVAIAVLVAMLWLPVLRIYGKSMQSTLHSDDIVLAQKGSSFKTGDVIAFYYNNKILVKRVIANSGDYVNIDKDGNVYVNDVELDEPYLDEKSYGETNIELPYQVPEGKVFVMGDNRAVSIDSRNTAIGCISEEQIVGKVAFRIWPLKSFGRIQ